MSDEEGKYDLEERTYKFAFDVRLCIGTFQWSRIQWTDVDQLLRSSGSVAANYVEANNSISKADFLYRIRISRKEASESRLWLRLLGATVSDQTLKEPLRLLYKECDELIRILAAILRNSTN